MKMKNIKSICFIIISIAIVYFLFIKTTNFIKVDSCLDNGGKWNYKESKCEFAEIDSSSNKIDEVLKLIEKQKIVILKKKEIYSLSDGQRNIALLPMLNDTIKNIYLVKVGENNESTFVVYYNFLVDANKMEVINSNGKLNGQ